MKKIFALVLATAMLSSTAFAADKVVGDSTGDTALNASFTAAPNSTIGIPAKYFAKGVSALTLDAGDFSNANFAVATRKFTKGANLVKSVTIDDEDEMVLITLNQDLNLLEPKNFNLVIEKLEIKAKKDIDTKLPKNNVKRTNVYGLSSTLTPVDSFRVGYTKVIVAFDDADVDYAVGKITELDKATDGTAYGIVSAEKPGVDIYVEGRAYDGDKIYVNLTNGVETEVLKAYPDADLRFAKLTTSGFTSNHTVNVTAEEDEFVYEIVDKKVVKTNLKWDADTYAWTGKTMGDKYYVISDIELKAVEAPAAGGTTTTNPETGANDVVGIAAALAVVSLVAAGAVSLKK